MELPGSLSALNVAARQWLDAVANVRLHGKTPQLPIHPTDRTDLLDLDLNPVGAPPRTCLEPIPMKNPSTLDSQLDSLYSSQLTGTL